MNSNDTQHRSILRSIAEQAMLERGLLPEFSNEALAEVKHLPESELTNSNIIARDLRELLWSSIDNNDSRDLDQLTVAEAISADTVKIFVAIADVDSCVKNSSAIDKHARHNTTSVYTAAKIFPMLPEKISTDLTSLNFDKDRLAVVVEILVGPDGTLHGSDVYRACVHNHAKLTYENVAAWLENDLPIPEAISVVNGLAENLQLQDRTAQRLRKLRQQQGALSFETVEARPVFDGDQISVLERSEKNRAKEIIEVFMITANGVTARYLSDKKFPSIRRVVRAPKRWERIVEIAAEHGFNLPVLPDSKALEQFLVQQKAADPIRFPDLSLAVIKLLGAGEYVAETPYEESPSHFGLAVKDYSHSTAPNRRYPDLITQRLLKAAIDGKPAPYHKDDLNVLAAHCTKAEDAANKVERQVAKSAAALLLQANIGERFDAIVTGASEKGTWVRLLNVPVEGKLVDGFEGVDVGNQLRVQLVDVNVKEGFIDFKNLNGSNH
jgi:VacB/RNase II family 3'-5' exoribonuclease